MGHHKVIEKKAQQDYGKKYMTGSMIRSCEEAWQAHDRKYDQIMKRSVIILWKRVSLIQIRSPRKSGKTK